MQVIGVGERSSSEVATSRFSLIAADHCWLLSQLAGALQRGSSDSAADVIWRHARLVLPRGRLNLTTAIGQTRPGDQVCRYEAFSGRTAS